MHHSALTRPIVFLSLLTAAVGQNRTQSSIEVEGGKITIDYTTTKIGDRSPADIPVGTVWRMSKDSAAGLTTTVPLATRNVTLPPGSYRISARRVSESKWELVIFQGATMFADKMAHQTSSLRLDEEEQSVDDLTISLKKSKRSSGVQARVKLTWGKYSLNTRFSVLGSTKVDGSLGGKPAVFTFFHIPVGKNQGKLSGGNLLPVGIVQQKGQDGVTYSIHARRQGNAGCDVIFENTTVAKTPGIIAANRSMQKRIQDFMARASDEQASQLKTRLEQMTKDLEALETQQKAASALREKVTLSADISNADSASKILKVNAKAGENGLSVAMTFGAKVAKFVVADASFKKQQ
jgi:Protein of unknown function (DUF2911)